MFPQTGVGGKGTRPNQLHIQQLHSQPQQHQPQYQQPHHSSHNVHQSHIQQQAHQQQQSLSHITLSSQNQQSPAASQQLHQYHPGPTHQNQTNLFYPLTTASHLQHQLLQNQQQVLQNNVAAISNSSPPTHIGGTAPSAISTASSSANLPAHGGAGGNSLNSNKSTRAQALVSSTPSMNALQHYVTHPPPMPAPFITHYIAAHYANAVVAAVNANGQFPTAMPGLVGQHAAPGAPTGQQALFQTPSQQRQQDQHRQSQQQLSHQQQTPMLQHPVPYYHASAATPSVSATQLQAQQHAQFPNAILPTSSNGQQRQQQPAPTYIMNPYTLQSSAMPPTGTRPPLLPHQSATTNGNIITLPMTQNRNTVAAGATTTFITPFCPPALQMSGAPQAILPATAMGNAPIHTYARMSGGQLSSLSSSSCTSLGSELKPRKHAIPIIDPITNENILEQMPQKKNIDKESPPPNTHSSAITITAPPPEIPKDQQVSAQGESAATQASSNNKTTLDKSTTVNVAQATTTKIDHQMQTDTVKDKYGAYAENNNSKPAPPLEEAVYMTAKTAKNYDTSESYIEQQKSYEKEQPVVNYAEQSHNICNQTFVKQQNDIEEQSRYVEQKQVYENQEYISEEEDETLEEENHDIYSSGHVPTVEFSARELHQGDATNLHVTNVAEENSCKRPHKQSNEQIQGQSRSSSSTLEREEDEKQATAAVHDLQNRDVILERTGILDKSEPSKQYALNQSKFPSDAAISSVSSSTASTPTHQISSTSTSGGTVTYQRQQQRQGQNSGFMPANATMHSNNTTSTTVCGNPNNVNPKKQVKFVSKSSPKENKQKVKGQRFEESSDAVSKSQTSTNSYNNKSGNVSHTAIVNVRLQTTDTNKEILEKSEQDNTQQVQHAALHACVHQEKQIEHEPNQQSQSTSRTGSEEDIVAQYLVSAENFRFLHESLSSEDDDITPRAPLHDDSIPSDIRQISFGDLVDYKELTKSKEIAVENSSSTYMLADTVDHAKQTVEATTTVTPAMVDAVTKNSKFKYSQKDTKAAVTHLSQTKNQSSAEKSAKRILQFRYSLPQLRDYGKSALSLKAPVVPYQKGDCISHLFVQRCHNAATTAQPYNLPPPPQPYPHYGTPYQHQSQHLYYGDMDSGKRRGGGGGAGGHMKKHHDYSILSGSGSLNTSSQMQNKDIIHVHLSLKEEIKLAKSENAWKPETLHQNVQRRNTQDAASTTSDNDDIEAVLKKVRGILNKLTPNNFEVLLKSMTSISMNTQDKMRQVMLLIFEKTVSEPNFAPTYAKFCKVLFQEMKADRSFFTSSLISRIQEEFESNVNNTDAKKIKLQPLIDKLNECQDVKNRQELQAEIEDKELQFRRRAWGTVRFIGEMYKQQLLHCDRVFNCVESLLQQSCEDKLEYMCKLLITVGHLVETSSHGSSNKNRMEQIFKQIREFVQVQKISQGAGARNGPFVPQPKISSRVRFMMQDVIELRDRQWDQPLPVTIQTRSNSKAEDKSSARKEQSSSILLPPGTARTVRSSNQHPQRHLRHSHQEKRYDSAQFTQKQYKILQPQTIDHRQQQQHPIDMNKLKFSDGTKESQSLGNKATYLWPQATAAEKSVTQQPPVQLPKQSSTDSTSPSDNGSRSRDDSASGYRNSFRELDKSDSASTAQSSSAEDLSVAQSMSTQECQKMLDRMLDHLLDSYAVVEQEVIAAWHEKSEAQQTCVLQYLLGDYLHLSEITHEKRRACAQIFSKLMDKKVFNRDVFLQAYEQFGEYFQDTLVDVPNGWMYEFEFLGPLLHEGVLQFNDIWLVDWVGKSEQFTEKFVHALLNYFTREFGAKYACNIWHSEFERGRHIFGPEMEKRWPVFMTKNKLDFILDPNNPAKQPRPVLHNVVEQLERISYLLRTTKDHELALDYINTNVQVTSNFVCSLASMSCEECVSIAKADANANRKDADLAFNVQLFCGQYIPLLCECIAEQEDFACACLQGVVESLRNRSQEGRTSNDLICKIFGILHERNVVWKEAFSEWYKQMHQSREEPSVIIEASVNNRTPTAVKKKNQVSVQSQKQYAVAGNTSMSNSSGSRSNQRPAADKNCEIDSFMEKIFLN